MLKNRSNNYNLVTFWNPFRFSEIFQYTIFAKIQKMDYFIVGDIHGCYYTFLEILKKWNREDEMLICVGDLIDRGNHSAKVVLECIKIAKEHPNAVFLKGNHEAEIIDYGKNGHNDNWITQGGHATLHNLKENHLSIETAIQWFHTMPLVFENEFLLVSHAGFSDSPDPLDEPHDDSILWNRKGLVNKGKLQVHGHTPLRDTMPFYTISSNSWNIDTGAYYGYGLTALKVTTNGSVSSILNIKTDPRDITI